MNGAKNIHWTSDPAVVDDFVLNRIEEPRRSRLEQHLLECDSCRAVVEKEKILVSALRSYGRSEFKKRLKLKLASPTIRRLPWPHIVSAAAVVVIIVGLGLYERWFMGTQIDAPEQGQPSETRRIERAPADVAGETDEKAGALTRAPEDDRRDRSVLRPRDPAALGDTEAGQRRMKADESGEKSRVQLGSQKGSEETRKKDLMDRASSDAHSDKQWVEGVVLDERENNVRSEAPAAAMKQLQKEEAGAPSGFGQLKEASSLRSFIVVHRDVRQNINLLQQSYGQMPVEQKKVQRESSSTNVPTLLERTESGLNITVYSDDLLQAGDIVTVSPVTVDSLVVGIGQKRIGYRVPGGWGQQSDALKKKK